MDDHVLAACDFSCAREHRQETAAVFGADLLGRQRRADDLRRGRQDVDDADHLRGRGAGGHLAGPTGDEGDLEAAFPDVVFAAADGSVDLEAGLEGRGLQEAFVLRPVDSAVVAREDHERVLGDPHLVERGEDATHARIELMDPITVRAGGALAGEVLVRRDRIMDGHRREIEEERPVLGLSLEPGRGLVGQHLHHALVLPAGRIEVEDLGLAVLHVLGSVSRLIIVAVGGGSRELHAGRDLTGAQAVDEAVLDEDPGEVAMVGGDAEMVVEAYVQGSGRELGLIIGAPLRVFVLLAVAQVPLADGGRGVAFGLEQGGQVDATGFDVEG